MIVYTISGLGADERIFKYMDIGFKTVHLDWIPPLDGETLSAYAKRFSRRIDTSKEFGLVGISFGGMIAVEIEKLLKPSKTIIISSAQTKHDLNSVFRFFGWIGVFSILPESVFNPPKNQIAFLFDISQENKQLLFDILKDQDNSFVKWAMKQIATWDNTHYSDQITMIHGTHDRVLTCPKRESVIKVDKGGHAMLVNQADQVNQLIKEALRN
ncbi:MAG: alpha/beta hydrolase [Reichenbachiella sp.]